RLNESPVNGRAHLKTGSLNGVRSIAGYVLDEKGRRWAVVFIVNHSLAGATKAAQDALLDWVYHQP
ncbi:MAG: D-alanyl-D-alanine carboxypeptidase, partial [Methylophilaceae bacterium]|nr:D-alanyl-D-alanine carboxypeptidase [Methylophilaceae bacterium]